MNWDSDELRSAALRLLLQGTIKATTVTLPLLAELEEIGWVVPAVRKAEYRLPLQQRDKFRRYLRVRWPQVDQAESAFATRPGMISAVTLRALRRLPLELREGITQLNRKTWSAWAGAHSKSGLSRPPDGVVLTTDEGLRLRANAGLQIIGEKDVALHVDACQALFGEVMVPERAFSRRWRVSGLLPKVILTVENIGAFIDFPAPTWLLLVHAPGRDTALATRFVGRLPAHIPWAHFGDLDPAGLRIALSIRSHADGRHPKLWIPNVVSELLETHSLPLELPWPKEQFPTEILEHSVVNWLVEHQRWLEHEPVVLLPGFVDDVKALKQRCNEAGLF